MSSLVFAVFSVFDVSTQLDLQLPYSGQCILCQSALFLCNVCLQSLVQPFDRGLKLIKQKFWTTVMASESERTAKVDAVDYDEIERKLREMVQTVLTEGNKTAYNITAEERTITAILLTSWAAILLN